MNRSGFTLIELMISVAILSTIMLALYSLNLTMTRGTLQQESLATLRDEGRTALQYVGRRLRMADSGTLVARGTDGNDEVFGNTATILGFQTVSDLDGNGSAVNQDYSVGLAPIAYYGPDLNDANGDGVTTRQLVEIDANGAVTRVFSRHLDPNGGITFQRVNGGIAINLVMRYPAEGIRPEAVLNLSQVVDPRN